MRIDVSEPVVTLEVHGRRLVSLPTVCEILGPVDLLFADAAGYDLVEVDANPDAARQPKRPDV